MAWSIPDRLRNHALFAYEAEAAVRIESGLLSTGEVDVPFDARRRLVMSGDAPAPCLIGALQFVDCSFHRTVRRTNSAANKGGSKVDLSEH